MPISLTSFFPSLSLSLFLSLLTQDLEHLYSRINTGPMDWWSFLVFLPFHFSHFCLGKVQMSYSISYSVWRFVVRTRGLLKCVVKIKGLLAWDETVGSLLELKQLHSKRTEIPWLMDWCLCSALWKFIMNPLLSGSWQRYLLNQTIPWFYDLKRKFWIGKGKLLQE